MRRIVILGGGFAGVYTAKNLLRTKKLDVHITLVNKSNDFVFTPLLHETATGVNRLGNVEIPIRTLFSDKRFHFVRTIATSVDSKARIVHTECGELPYDILVVATGAKTNFYGIDGAASHALPLKTASDATCMRNHLITMIEHGTHCNKEKAEPFLTVVVCGGGPNGVELAAELAEFLKDYTSHKCFPIVPKVLIVQRDNSILSGQALYFQESATKRLQSLGVEILTGMDIRKITEKGVYVNNRFIAAKTVIWAGGVVPSTPKFDTHLIDDRGFIPVADTLQSLDPAIFVIGDCAKVINPDGKPVPQLAQAAVREANVVAKNIIAHLNHTPLSSFVFKQQGFLLSIGRRYALVDLLGLRLSGLIGWSVGRIIYLSKVITLKKKLQIIVDWAFDLVFRREITET